MNAGPVIYCLKEKSHMNLLERVSKRPMDKSNLDRKFDDWWWNRGRKRNGVIKEITKDYEKWPDTRDSTDHPHPSAKDLHLTEWLGVKKKKKELIITMASNRFKRKAMVSVRKELLFCWYAKKGIQKFSTKVKLL